MEDRKTIHTIKSEFDVTDLAKEVFQNMPEYSDSMACIGYKYGFRDAEGNEGDWNPDNFKFKFKDYEDGKVHIIGIEEAEKGVVLVIDLVNAKKLHVGGITDVEALRDPCNWDAEVVDAAVQCAIFGEVIYG